MLFSHCQAHRGDASQTGNLRLQQGAHRGDHHLWYLTLGTTQPTQHLHASTDGVRTRAQTLMRQGLPRWVVTDSVGAEPRLQGSN